MPDFEMKTYYLRPDHTVEEISFEDYIKEGGKRQTSDERRVGLDILPNGYRVSTVFLSHDHQYGEGPPLLFETMVFADREGGVDDDMERYSTWDEAVAGHARMVEKWKSVEGIPF